MSTENVNEVAAAASTGSSLMSLLPMVVIFAIFYFFLIRPQTKRAKLLEQTIGQVKKGDKVIAAGGLYGSIHKIEDNVIYLEIAENVRIKALKSSIVEVIGKAAEEPKAAAKAEVTEEKPVKKAVKKTIKK